MSEDTIYSDQEVSVSTSRIVVRGTTYALRNISSVKMTTTPPQTGCAIVLIIVGVICALVLLGVKNGAVAAILIGGGCIAGGVAWLRAAKADYHVTITSNAGEVRALTSKDRNYIDKIVGAVNEAIIRYK